MFNTPEEGSSNGSADSSIESVESHPEYKVNVIPKAEQSYNHSRNKVIVTIHDTIK